LYIREWREVAGMTQQELAQRARLTVGTISRLECGHTVPHKSTEAALERALGLRRLQLRHKPEKG